MEEKKKGRPKTTVEDKLKKITFDLEKIEKILIHGLTDKELAEILDVDERTLTNWKQDPEFFSVLKRGKLKADLEIENSLYQKAKGYNHKDTYFACFKGQIITQEYTKHYPPDTTACIFWLKNRRPEKWRDKQEILNTNEAVIIYDNIK